MRYGTIHKDANGVRFTIRLTPKGGRQVIEGWKADAEGAFHLKARVSAAPEDGKANAALIALLAKSLAVAKSAVRIVRGETARLKAVEIEGDPAALASLLEAFGEAK